MCTHIRTCFIGWSNNRFNSLPFRSFLETKEITTSAAEKDIDVLCCVEAYVVEMLVKPVH